MFINAKRALLALAAVLLIVPTGVAFAQGVATAPAATAPPAVEVHGYMQNRLYQAAGATTEFRSERISLSALGRLPEDSNAYVEVYYHPWAPSSGLYLESAYYDRPVGDARFRIGKGRRLTFGITPAYPNRKTSNYGIVSETFTQDRIQGIQYYYKKNVLDLGVSVHTGYRLGTRAVGEIPGDTLRNTVHQVPHLALRDLPGELSEKLQLSARLGGRWANGFTAGISGSFSGLDPRDLAALTGTGTALRPTNPLTGATPASSLVAPGTTDDDFNQWGLDFTKKWTSGWVFQGEWYNGSASTLDYDAWNLLGGYEFKNGWKAFARYSKKNMDTPATDNPLSWDLQQTSISVVQPISKSVWIQYEYEINGEDTNTGASVDNNLFFVELFTGF